MKKNIARCEDEVERVYCRNQRLKSQRSKILYFLLSLGLAWKKGKIRSEKKSATVNSQLSKVLDFRQK